MISVAICTFNRAESLRRTLDSLVNSRAPLHGEWELLVVDNNSNDETRQVVTSFESRLPVRYVFEEQQGLSAARNCAIREFHGDVLLFTDDDVTLDPSWLFFYDEAAHQHPTAAYFGGRVIPFWPEGKPHWLHDESLPLISGLLVRFHLGDGIRKFGDNEPTPYGASFALRRSVIEEIGRFNCDLGVKARVPGRGEESEYLSRVRAAGFEGVYVGDAVANHWTNPARLTLPYLYRYGVQTGIALRLTGSVERGSIASAG